MMDEAGLEPDDVRRDYYNALRKLSNRRAANSNAAEVELGQLIAFWSSWPTSLKKDIMALSFPDSLSLRRHRILR